jgi:hypothetical protein
LRDGMADQGDTGDKWKSMRSGSIDFKFGGFSVATTHGGLYSPF